MVFHQQHRLYLFIILLSGLFSGCAKNKLDAGLQEDNLLTLTNSNIRLFNISQRDLGIVVNNTLLAQLKSTQEEETNVSTIGKLIFPEGIWKNRSSFTIPTVLLNKAGAAFITIQLVSSPVKFNDTLIVNDPTRPMDYYLLPDGKIAGFSRNNTPPVDSRNFKIRIMNLGDPNTGFNSSGPVTLTYANGMAVDPKLTEINNGNSSDYTELPYGAYQFKLFAGAGNTIDFKRQLVTDNILPAFNQCLPGILPQEGFMPPIVTFKPGGVYTIMVFNNMFTYDYTCGGTPGRTSQYGNAYQVLTELDPGPNLSYARINAVNTIPGKKIIVKADGQMIGNGPLQYIGDQFQTKAIAAEYRTIIQGEHSIQAFDEAGNLLAETTIQLYPFDNLTFWVRTDQQGKAGIIFTSNDMTNTLYKTAFTSSEPPDDGTNGERRRVRYSYAFQSRFLNFCNEQPSITFTNNGQLFLPEFIYPDTLRPRQAYCNMQPGIVPQKNGSIIFSLPNIIAYNPDGTPAPGAGGEDLRSYFPAKIWVNNSVGGMVPGSLLSQIIPITGINTFVANDAMYPSAYTKPPAENGIYTMALVGGQGGATPRLVAIKHNK